MILQALCDYYKRKPDLPRIGFGLKAIPFVIEVNDRGQLVQIEDTRHVEGIKRIARNFLVPQAVKKTSGVAANFLWDTAEYVLDVTRRDEPDRVRLQHHAFKKKLKELARKTEDAGLRAVLAYLTPRDRARLEADPLWPEILETNPILTFRLSGDHELVCQRALVMAALEARQAATSKIICLVSGEADSLERLHTAIRGVWGAQTTGANIVSFNKDAFSSFGKEQGANAPIGKHAAFGYTTALNYLLSKESTQRIQVGDTSIVFWSERSTNLEDIFADLFSEPPKDDPTGQTRAIEALFKPPQMRVPISEEDRMRFYVLGLAPNSARLSIRFWQIGTIAEMSGRIRRHFDDLNIVYSSFEKPHLSLFRLLKSTAAQGESKNILPNLGGEFMRAIFTGLPYPQTLLQALLRRISAEREVTYPRAALIKAYLNRHTRHSESQEKEITMSLDESNSNPGYRMGRLFASLEKIQEEAVNPGATIRDRFYGIASRAPVAVLANLMRLKNHHIARLGDDRKRYFEMLIGQIMSGINEFPSHLSLADQARFAIGYYHQRQSFFTKS